MTYGEAYTQGEHFLAERGFAEASSDAWILFEHASGLTRARYLMMKKEECPLDILERYQAMTDRRSCRVPVQYITGQQEFLGRSFLVNKNVLIPRPETELLVLEAEKCLRETAGGSEDKIPRVLDICTGSGCIIISLAKQALIEAVAADISGEALALARQNAERLGADVTWIRGDLFENVEGTFDCIVSNPPYIRSGEIAGLMPEVRDFEPRLALDGHMDGLYFYRRIIEDSRAHLNAGGWLLFEIGHDQGADVTEQMRAAGFAGVHIIKDLAGLSRIVVGRKAD